MASGKILVPGSTFFYEKLSGDFCAFLAFCCACCQKQFSRENLGARPELTPHPKSGFLYVTFGRLLGNISCRSSRVACTRLLRRPEMFFLETGKRISDIRTSFIYRNCSRIGIMNKSIIIMPIYKESKGVILYESIHRCVCKSVESKTRIKGRASIMLDLFCLRRLFWSNRERHAFQG